MDKHIVDVLIEERAQKLMARPGMWKLVKRFFYPVLGYDQAVHTIDTVAPMSALETFDYLARRLALEISVSGLHHVPQTGCAVIAANHPAGIADGVALYAALREVRDDISFFANRDAIRAAPNLKDMLIPVSAMAITPSRVLGISRSSFFRMLSHADARDRFIASLFKKLRYLSDQVHHLNSLDVEERFFRFLREHYGEKESYSIHLPKKEIAAAIGTIPETFSRLVKRLSTLGIITWQDDELTLKENFWKNFID